MAATTIGDRVRASIPMHLSQRRLAPDLGMTHDALSRAINGQRHFSVLEIAKLAERLDVDTHWLITGQTDPFQVRVAARHPWGRSSAEQEETDAEIVARVVDAYRAAYADAGRVPTSLTPLPPDPSELRGLLPQAGIRNLAAQVEGVLGVDVVRDPGLQTDYSFRIGDHAVVLLKSTIYWFRANWSIAHELGHLALGHHVRERATPAQEGPADTFASQFLLPEEQVRATNWRTLTAQELALWIWDSGVSTAAVSRRLNDLKIKASDEVRAALEGSTPKLMRAHVDLLRSASPSYGDPIWERENATTGRQFPERVVAALTERVEAGEADPYVLAWVREVPVDELTWPEPDLDAASPEYEALSEARASDWFDLFDAR
jgi:Zn-dependent peptidase ImmA (M78 family)/plasmid maintenance system antidote protein VapI